MTETEIILFFQEMQKKKFHFTIKFTKLKKKNTKLWPTKHNKLADHPYNVLVDILMCDDYDRKKGNPGY